MKHSDSIRRVLSEIKNFGCNKRENFREAVVNVFFSDCALFASSDSVCLLMPPGSSRDECDAKLGRMLYLVSIIDNLCSENILIRIPGKQSGLTDVVYANASRMARGQSDNEWTIGENMVLTAGDADGLPCISKGTNQILKGQTMLPDDLSEKIMSTLNARYYPTAAYEEYAERDYLTPTQFSLKKAVHANRLALAAIVVALIIAAVSWTMSFRQQDMTMDATQFKELTDSISAIKSSMPKVILQKDTLHVHRTKQH